jgi:predicted ArsR family transcriptional regulator
MDLPQTPEDDVLALPVRARLFDALTRLRRPATTQELAAAVGRHPNTVRVQLDVLSGAGLLERRTRRQARGRPRHEWAIGPAAQPGGEPPQAHAQLARWLARALTGGREALDGIEAGGREIGRDLAPDAGGRSLAEAMRDALTALGFAPRQEEPAPGRLCFRLGNCPYRDAVRENQAVVCTLHRGITQGLLDRLAPDARLEDFVAKDPYTAGCLVHIAA